MDRWMDGGEMDKYKLDRMIKRKRKEIDRQTGTKERR